MQAFDASSSADRSDEASASVPKSLFGDHRYLLNFLKRSRSKLKTHNVSLKPRKSVINMHNLNNNRTMMTERENYSRNGAQQDRIVINISGTRFETFKSTLEMYPDTLLGNENRRKYYYDQEHQEYFFDRHRSCFEAILYYYQSNGRLRRPSFVPIDMFLEEVMFFDLGQEALAQLRKDENLKEITKIRLPRNRCRRYLWATLEHPEFSLIAKFVHIFSLIIILLATVALAIETLPQYWSLADDACNEDYPQHHNITASGHSNSTNYNITASGHSNNTNHTRSKRLICPAYFSSPFVLIQTICVAFFTLELILRIISMPSACDFIKNIMNWIDVFAVLPYYVTLAIRFSGQDSAIEATAHTALQILRILRFARVLKFYRIFKNIKAIRVLTVTLRESMPDFFILVVTLTLLAFVFGTAVYMAEQTKSGAAFDSIPEAIYWGIITITGVGYGDIVPVTPAGRVVTCLCALSGAITMAMLFSVLVDRYHRVFNRKLYIKPENPDFDEYSNEDNDDLESGRADQSPDYIIDNADVLDEQGDASPINRDAGAFQRNNDEEE